MSPATGEFLAPTRLVDAGHPDILAAAVRLTAAAKDDIERAVRLHDFVRDEIRFGWTPAFDEQKASEVLESRLGFCNTKSTLFMALLRAVKIPARVHFVTINRKILEGLIRPPSAFVDHSYTEVLLENRWVSTDSYTVDASLHGAAMARCHAQRRPIGYGVHTGGRLAWDGRSNSFAQFVNDDTVPHLSDADFGSFVDLDAFRATGSGRNPMNPLARFFIPFLTARANRRAHRIRVALESGR